MSKDESQFFSISISSIQKLDGLIGYVVVLRDITGHKLLDKEIMETEKMKSDFISIASHELRTPISLIQGYTELIAMDHPDDSEAHAMSSVIFTNLNRLTGIVDALLNIDGIEKGDILVDFKPVEVTTLIDHSISLIEGFARLRNIKISIDIQNNTVIAGDESKLSQVLYHLLINAIKYTPDGGKIAVRMRDEGIKIHFEIEDSGIGIHPDEHTKVFLPFYEVQNTMHHKTGVYEYLAAGAGIGLALVKGFVEMHNGQVWLESKPGEGSIFHFTLNKWIDSNSL